jgi:hypothetical protein
MEIIPYKRLKLKKTRVCSQLKLKSSKKVIKRERDSKKRFRPDFPSFSRFFIVLCKSSPITLPVTRNPIKKTTEAAKNFNGFITRPRKKSERING